MNKKKLNSHMWFFEGFCRFINPDYCYIIDAGVEPNESSLRMFFKAFESDLNIGGLCGFMECRHDRRYDDYGDRLDEIADGDIDAVSELFQSNIFNI
jgi:chitin synthase